MPRTVVLALGSNLGNRLLNLRRALHAIGAYVRLVRVSSVHETDPVDAPRGSPRFLNLVAAGYTDVEPEELLDAMQRIELALGRVRRGVRNAPRTIDLDLIFYSGEVIRTARLIVPHPRYREREFVMAPMREIFRSAAAEPPLLFRRDAARGTGDSRAAALPPHS